MLQEILSITFITGFLAATLRLATPILITALGEMVTERSGIMNLGIEGIMIIGAFVGFSTAFSSGNLWVGILCGGLAGLLFGAIMGIGATKFQANQIVAGLGIWILCQGLSSLLNRSIFGIATTRPEIPLLDKVPIPLLSGIPILGETIFNQNILVYLTLCLIPIFIFFFKRTAQGLNIDAVGENPHAADAAGLNVTKIRVLAASFGGLMAGFGGAYMPIALFGLYTDDLSTGLGWMAIAVVIFGKWQPAGILVGALIFGAANALQYRLQSINFPLPYQLILMIPFVVTLIIVILFVRGDIGPSALTKPYSRSEGN